MKQYKNYIYIFSLVILLNSCFSQNGLYRWGTYESTSYKYVKTKSEKDLMQLIETYEYILKYQPNNKVPPGICADYGFILIQQGRIKKGRDLIEREKRLYPESSIFMDRVLKMIDSAEENKDSTATDTLKQVKF